MRPAHIAEVLQQNVQIKRIDNADVRYVSDQTDARLAILPEHHQHIREVHPPVVIDVALARRTTHVRSRLTQDGNPGDQRP